MITKKFWVCTNNLRIYGELKLAGDSVVLPQDLNTQSLLKSGILSDVKPEIVYNTPVEKDFSKPPPEKEEIRPKRRRKKHGNRSTARTSSLREPT